MKRLTSTVLIAILAASMGACVSAKRPALQPEAPVAGASLWHDPADLRSRDFYYGPWGADNAPDPNDTFRFLEGKHSGVNLGMTVVDSKGREWSVKQPYPGSLDNEGPVEVALSRLLSGIGYHQPPIYYLPAFNLKDDWGTRVEVGGRFRLKHPSLKEVDTWKWEANPFIGTAPFEGLLALLLMFNSTDLKNSNNSLYERRSGDLVELWYTPRDLGAALGDWQRLAPRKNHIESFERQPYILGVNNGFVDFAYSGWYRKFVDDRIKPEHVAWASNLLGRLSEKQWQDAFRAGGYEPEVANRFIAKLKAKIAEGRALSPRAANDNRQ